MRVYGVVRVRIMLEGIFLLFMRYAIAPARFLSRLFAYGLFTILVFSKINSMAFTMMHHIGLHSTNRDCDFYACTIDLC